MKNIVKAAEKFDLEERKKGNSPPQIFQDLLINKTEELCKKLGADKEIACIGAYLMDIKIGQALREGRVQDHIRLSLQAARKFLGKYNLSGDIQEKIENIIESHHMAIPCKSLEAEIVANADCFKFLHPKGAIFFLTDLGKRDMPFLEALNYFEQKVEEKYKIVSLNVCKKEVEKYYLLLRELINLARQPI